MDRGLNLTNGLALHPSRRDRAAAVSAVLKTKEEAQADKARQVLQQQQGNSFGDKLRDIAGLGDSLGPIGLTIGGDMKEPVQRDEMSWMDGAPLSPPIGVESGEGGERGAAAPTTTGKPAATPVPSIHSMSTSEWRSLYEKDGTVDLWMEEEFNAGSRLVGGRAVHKGGEAGIRTGEGPSRINAVKHKVKIFNHYADQVVHVEVPEDRYILWEAEDEGLELPYACRMGCCTACAVRIKEGEMYQPEALGISSELREKGYGLMCVGFPLTDLVLETVPEDEVYELQFGEYFATQALDPSNPSNIERDDFALSIANMDE